MSVRLRLTLWYSTILAAMILLFGSSLYFILSTKLTGDYEKRLNQYSGELYKQVRLAFSIYYKGGPPLDFSLLDVGIVVSSEYYFQVYERGRDLTFVSPNVKTKKIFMELTPQILKKISNGNAYNVKQTINGKPFLVRTIPIFLNNQMVGALQTSVYLGDNEIYLGFFKWSLMMIGLITIALAATLGWFLARKTLKPIDDVIEAAQLIEQSDDLHRRIAYNGPPDEMGRLTGTINGMLDRIERIYSNLDEAYEAQRRFVSDASHELRTPLTTIRGNVEHLEKVFTQKAENREPIAPTHVQLSLEAMRDIASEAERMSRLVNELLSLARADAGQSIAKGPVIIKALVEDVKRKANFLPRSADFRAGDLSALDGLGIYGNEDYIRQLLFIFIENAFKYTPEGTVTLDAVKAGGQIGIRIADTGIGMDEKEVPSIFKRFYRADPSRGVTSGSGLGLSIAKWIIDEHQGSVEVTTKKDAGSTFIIWLPISFAELEP